MVNNGNGIYFNGEGPVMAGTWYNPENGDTFTVRDTYFENNQLIVITTDGRQLDYNFIQNYVKTEKSIKNNTKSVSNDVLDDELPPEVKALVGDSNNSQDGTILQEDLNIINKPMAGLGNLNTPHTTVEVINNENVNFAIIEKALQDKTKPELSSKFSWKCIPEKEMHLLIDVLGITPDELVSWYLKSLDNNFIVDTIRQDLKSYIHDVINKPDKDNQEVPTEDKPNKNKKSKK